MKKIKNYENPLSTNPVLNVEIRKEKNKFKRLDNST
jgi:hypothetical protein